MSTIAEPAEPAQAQLQAKIDELVHTQLKLLAVRKKCHPRDLVNEALKDYLPKVERALDRTKITFSREPKRITGPPRTA